MKKLLRKLDKKTDSAVPLYFQMMHSLGIFAAAFILSFLVIDIFQILNPYIKIVLLAIWILLIFITSHFAVKSWRKGFLILTAFLLLFYLFAIINMP